MNRFDATRWLVQQLTDECVVSNLGFASFDLYIAKDRPRNFYMGGAMGMTSSVGLGLALARPDLKVIVLDGDGSLLMNLGSLATIACEAPDNLIYIVWDDAAYQTTGGQPTPTANSVDLVAIAQGAGLVKTVQIETLADFQTQVREALCAEGPWCLVAKIERTGAQGRVLRDPIYLTRRFLQSMER